MGNPGGSFEDDESTVMIPTLSEGSFFADRYRMQALLGSGAMGRVYAAVELHSGRKVAIKVLHKERLGEEETVARFQREAEVLASIGHPCIVEIYAFHHLPDGSPYLAMELLEGVTLKTRLRNAGRFEDPRELQPILDGVCGALDAAHSRGVVHRDMKPDNLFLPATGDPRVKIVDFGLSRMARNDKELTHSGMILGTPRYMAPEQIRDAASAGPAVDIYSLAIVVYEALSGQSPYPAQDYGQLLGCVLETRTTPLSKVRPDLPAGISDVILRAMAAEPSARFGTCAAFANAFGHAIGSPSRVSELRGATPPTPSIKRQRGPSLSPLGMNKGSTLAFDAHAAMASLEADGRLPSPSLGDPSQLWKEEAEPTTPEATGRAGPSSPVPPSASGERAGPPPASPAAPQASLPAQGGDTLYLGNVGAALAPPPGIGGPAPGSGALSLGGPGIAPGFPQAPGSSSPSYSAPSYAPIGQASPYPQTAAHPVSSAQPLPPRPVQPAPVAHQPAYAPAPAPPAKSGRWGYVLFFLLLVIVVVGSAAAGLALRAHKRGELDLPFEVPGVTRR